MGPGPCNPYPEAVEALARPMLGHLDPEFVALLDETCDRLRTVVPHDQPADAADQRHRLGGHGGGVRQRRRHRATSVVVGVNGVFGERMCDVAARCGAEVVRGRGAVGPADRARALLAAHPRPQVIAVVHAETSTGVRQRHRAARRGQGRRAAARRLRHVARRHRGRHRRVGRRPRLQRHAEVPRRAARPGAAHRSRPGPRAARRAQPESWYLDLQMIGQYTGAGHRRPHVPPHRADLDDHVAARRPRRRARRGARRRRRPATPSAAGCCRTASRRAGLRAVRRRGPPAARAHHRVGARRRRRGRRRASSCSSATASRSAAGSARSPGRVWRIGCMGHTARPRNVTLLLGALAEVLGDPDDCRCSGRRVDAAPARADRLPGVAGGAPPQRRLADQVGAAPHPGRARRRRGPRRVRGPLLRPPARAPARHRLRLRHLRRAAELRRRDQPERRSSGARSRTPTSATGSTRRRPATATCPRRSCAVARYAFDELHLHRLQIAIIPRNQRSRRVVEKLELRDEGIALRYLEINGVWEDHVRYAITAEEWQDRKDELTHEWLG